MTATPPDTKIATLVPRDRPFAPDRPPLLSKAKSAPPRMPAHIVARDRYRQWLDTVLAHDVTLLAAPIGYGKTVFAGQLHDEMFEAGFAASWVSCYRTPPGRLAEQVTEAVRAAVGEWHEPGACVSRAALAIDLANQLHDRDGPVLLCLDDVDQIADIDDLDFLTQLIGNCPTTLHLLLTCRDAHRLPPSLIEQRGTVLRLDARILRARDAELAEYLSLEGIPANGARPRALNEALGGWWRALQRVAAAMKRDGWNAGADDWAQRCVQWVTPLLRETLDAMPERQRAVLARCAVARALTPELAVLLSGDDLAGSILRDAARLDQFVEAVPGTPNDYAIHPALRAVLLADAGGPSSTTVKGLRAQAIDWHVERGELDQAISIALTAGDVEACADLLVRHGMAAIELSGPCAVREAVGRLPRARIDRDDVLCRVASWAAALSGGDPSVPGEPPDAIDDTERAALAEIGNDGEALTTIPDPPSGDDFRARLLVATRADRVLRAGDHRQVQAMLRPVLRYGRAAGIGFAEAIALVTMADLHRVQGRPADAQRLLQEGLAAMAPGAGRRSGTAALLAVALADTHYLRNDIATAQTLIDEFLPVLIRIGLPRQLFRGYRVAIRIAAVSGRPDEALALIEAAEEMGADRDLATLTALGAVERVRLHIPLITSLDEILPPDEEEAAIAAPDSRRARLFALLSEARAFEAIANLDRPRLTVVANRLLLLAERTEDVELRVVGTLLNVLPQLSGRCDRMIEIEIVKFLNRAAALGFVRSIVDLLEITGVRTAQDFDRAEYAAGSFLALLRLSRPVRSDSLGSPAVAAPALSFFTGRDIEIVTALREGETNKMIARRLGVTPETVKWHMKSLMRKLRANSREEVVNHALVLGISPGREAHISAEPWR